MAAMYTRAGRTTATGFVVLSLAVIAGVGSGKLGLLLGFVGVLAGANLIAVAVRMADEPTTPTIVNAVIAGVGALTAFLRRNLGVVGLAMASSAVAAVAGDVGGPVLCFSSFALFLLGVSLITIGVLGAGLGQYFAQGLQNPRDGREWGGLAAAAWLARSREGLPPHHASAAQPALVFVLL
ncbi:hypothetical protein EJB05_53606, partial [Eragrostis curvula]